MKLNSIIEQILNSFRKSNKTIVRFEGNDAFFVKDFQLSSYWMKKINYGMCFVLYGPLDASEQMIKWIDMRAYPEKKKLEFVSFDKSGKEKATWEVLGFVASRRECLKEGEYIIEMALDQIELKQ